MLDLLQDVEPADLIAFARSVPDPADFQISVAGGILPPRKIQGVKYRTKGRTRRVNTAKYRAYDTSTPRGRREIEHEFLEGFLPPLGLALDVKELETILSAMENGSDDAELIDLFYEDVVTEVLGIKSRLEQGGGQVLTFMKFTLAENGLTLEADYDPDPAFLPTAAVLWTDADATPIDDELSWISTLVHDGEGRPAKAMASESIAPILAKNAQYKGYYYGEADGTNRPTLTPTQLQSVRATFNLPPITTYDVQVRVDGVNTRVTPENRFYLLPGGDAADFGETQYGTTAEALVMSRQGNPKIERDEQPGIITTKKVSDDPVYVRSRSTAVAMPVLYSNKAHVCAQVTA
jgi:hypothetical protein